MVGKFMIDGVEIPTPSSFTAGIEDISSSDTGRTMDGIMHKDVIAVKATYDCSWQLLNWDDCARILNAVDGKSRVQFTYPDPRVPNVFVTGDFYVGKRSAPAYVLVDGKERWKGVSFSFVEV